MCLKANTSGTRDKLEKFACFQQKVKYLGWIIGCESIKGDLPEVKNRICIESQKEERF